jgi:protein tyrosine phosphatase
MRTYIYMLKKVDSAAENSGFEKQLKLLEKVSPSKDSFSYSGSQAKNETRNRYRTYVPPDERRVLLKGPQSQGSGSTYICAMFVDVKEFKIYFAVYSIMFVWSHRDTDRRTVI